MSDNLIERLRDFGDNAEFEPHMYHVAADEIERLTAERDAALAGAGLVEIDLAKSEKQNHPDIKTDGTLYLAKISGGWFLGRFSKQWYGLSFNNWGNAGCQFDAPGTNASRWERLIDCSRALGETK